MPYPPREEAAGAIHHVMGRGTARGLIFVDEADYRFFLETLTRIVARRGWICHAFCLMPNHYHLVIETPTPTLAEGMRDMNSIYARRFNVRHARVGHLFAARYKSIRIQREEHFLELCRYVVLNPVRAGDAAARPENARWTSYAATAGLAEIPPFLTVEAVLARFAGRRSEACRLYRQFVAEGVEAA